MRVKLLSLAAIVAALALVVVAQQAAGLQLAQAQLGTAVENRQLTGAAASFPVNSQVYLWMEFTGGGNQTVTVTWKHGNVTHAAQLAIGGSHWRTWAVKTVAAAGDWSVTVAGPDGAALKTLTFTVK
jgi:hypothetical protein